MKNFIETEIEATELATDYFETTFEVKRAPVDFGFFVCTRFLWGITATGGGVVANFFFYSAFYILLFAAIIFDIVSNALFVCMWALYAIFKHLLTNSSNVVFRYFLAPVLFLTGIGTILFLIYKLFTTEWESANQLAEKFLQFIF